MTYTFKLARRLAILQAAMVAALLVLAGCSDDTTAPEAGPVQPNAALSIRVVPSSVTIETNQKIRFRGERRSHGREAFPTPLAWESTGGAIDAAGNFTASIPGTYKVVGRGRGRQKPDTAVVVVVPPVPAVVGITLTPDSVVVTPAATHSFTAAGLLSDGSTTAIGVTWQATGGTIDASGLYTAGDVTGTYRVIATNVAGTLADTSTATVEPAPTPPSPPAVTLSRVYLTPATVSLATGATKQFSAYGRTSAGDSVAVTVSFTATGGTMTSSGLYTAATTGGTYRVSASAGGLADTSVVTVAAPAPAPAPAPTGAGIPFGSFHLPNEGYGLYGATGALKMLSTSSASADLAAAKAAKMKLVVVLPGGRKYYTNADHTFNLSMWKSRMDQWIPYASLLKQYVDNGTIILNYVVDEPNCLPCWGGQSISHATLQEMTRYSKQILPFIPTVIRVIPGWLKTTPSWPNLDAAWAQYEGPLHRPCPKMTLEECTALNVADAKAINVALVLGLNTLDGGDGSSRINGTYNADPNLTDAPSNLYRYQMTAAEYQRAGSVFAAEPYACGLISWRYSATLTDEPAYVQQFDLRSDVHAAGVKINAVAAAHAPRSCRKPGT